MRGYPIGAENGESGLLRVFRGKVGVLTEAVADAAALWFPFICIGIYFPESLVFDIVSG